MSQPRCDCGGVEWVTGALDPDENGRCVVCRTFPTLGHQVANFIEESCVIPDRDQMGDPFILTKEQEKFLNWFYRIDPATKFTTGRGAGRWKLPFVFHRGAQLVRSQKWGKGPFSAAVVCAEAAGPVVFDGWDANGESVGRPQPSPLIQITALAEDQTGNIWSALQPMIELGPFAAEIPDTGLTRINLPAGGRIEPVTSAAKTRLGQRVTFIVQDQTESWVQSNGGRALADNQRRNIAGMGGRWLSTPNAWDPAEESVAQHTSEHEHTGVYHDDINIPDSLSIRNKQDRRKGLKLAYGDSYWVDLDRIDAEIEALLPRDPAQAERWFLNRKNATAGRAFQADVWDAAVAPDPRQPKDLVTVGVDGARFRDALAVVGTHVESGWQWEIGIWERPDTASPDYEHPFDLVDGALTDVFNDYEVWRVYIDPQQIEHLVATWQGRWGDKRVIEWHTNRPRQIAYAVRAYTDALAGGDVSHRGDEMLSRHVKQAVRMKLNVWDEEHRRQLHSLQKDRDGSPRKIDGAMAAVLSWEARCDAIAAGAEKTPVYRTVGFA